MKLSEQGIKEKITLTIIANKIKHLSIKEIKIYAMKNIKH